MTLRLIKGGSRFESIASFSRAVVDDDMIKLTGTTGHYHDTESFLDGAAEAEPMRHAFALIDSSSTQVEIL